ncbi:MAG: hormogonium polysaccharide biosynthesis protein HpsA, partial [Microcoleus sp.]|uniref:hormogonium polysaccharide biosynthesis protein HpsA n=1 Tax=Microcoleus sp. TaxID=44472 RepID=UPI003C77B495
MFKSKLSKVIVSLLRRIAGVTRSGAKRLMRAMLQALMAMSRRARLPVAGFVLPTVTMVLLVVILLTVAITLRSFDRANTARNVRVNQQVLAAATPALDRAKAKIQFLLYEDPQRPTSTPSDAEMYRMISDSTGAGSGTDTYTFGDETRLKLKADLDGNGSILSPDLPITDTRGVETNESINTAWRYPVDTNNDGKFDTFTLYGIFFRSPPRIASGANAGEFTRPRKPLEARTPPMSLGVLKKGCEAAAGNIASLVGDSGWYSINGRLLKSFFVYTVNVPITEEDMSNGLDNRHQEFTGTSSISALEYQQDQSRIPLSNNAVVYEDDLEISPGPPLNINGRMITNSNLIVTGLGGDNNLKLYQVSSQNSCFYEQENSKIIVGGNVVNGGSGDKFPANKVQVHLFNKAAPITDKQISETLEDKKSGQSVKSSALDVLYNNAAFQERIDLLVKWQVLKAVTEDPLLVQQRPKTQSREQALENYFKLTTRKVPFAEVAFGESGITDYGPPPTGTSPIEPGS